MPKLILDVWKGPTAPRAPKDHYGTEALAKVLKKRHKLPDRQGVRAVLRRQPPRATRLRGGHANTANAYPNAKVNGKKGLNKGQAKTLQRRGSTT